MGCFSDERQSGPQAMRDILLEIQRYYPDALKAVNSTLLPSAEAQLAADKAVAPGYADINIALNEQYGPRAARTAAQIDDITAKAASQRELDLAKTTGRELVTEADLAQRKLDPEFYKNREELSTAISGYLKAADPAMTETELEAIRRGMGRTPSNPDSKWGTAERAFQFGKEGQAKVDRFGNAITNVAASLPTMRSGIPGFEVATRRSVGNTGENRVGQATGNAGAANTFGFANNFLNTAGGIQQQSMSAQLGIWDKLDKVNNYIATAAKVAGGAMGGGA